MSPGMANFSRLRNYSQAPTHWQLRFKNKVSISFEIWVGLRESWCSEWLAVLLTFASPSKKLRISHLFSLCSSVGTAHRLCGWCHRHAQRGRCQYHWVYWGLLRLRTAVLCPTAPYPCNKQVRVWENEFFIGPGTSLLCSLVWKILEKKPRVSVWKQPSIRAFHWVFVLGQVTALSFLICSSKLNSHPFFLTTIIMPHSLWDHWRI